MLSGRCFYLIVVLDVLLKLEDDLDIAWLVLHLAQPSVHLFIYVY